MVQAKVTVPTHLGNRKDVTGGMKAWDGGDGKRGHNRCNPGQELASLTPEGATVPWISVLLCCPFPTGHL